MWCAAVPVTADAFTTLPTRHLQYNVHTGPGFRCDWRECWGFHGLRLTKEAEEPLEDQKLATTTPRQRLNSNDQLKSTDFCKTWSHCMSHGPTLCSRHTFLNGLGEGTARAQDRRIRCEGGSQWNFAPQGGERRSKMECMAGRKWEFSLCQTDDFVF